jgi:NAD-dependent SIR2 family protein deacetylase
MAENEGALQRAAEAVARASGVLITAGAGMGVDSGLPDFRGTEGFWRAYPPFARLGLRFEQMATPRHFAEDPPLAWGFYGHRLELYRETEPHPGFRILRRWAERAARMGGAGGFVFTSNVDGHFQRAGFDPDTVVECHGSILHLQCTGPCRDEIWDADGMSPRIDPSTFRAEPPLPSCPACGAVARPNVLMFGDRSWLPRRTGEQERRLQAWLARLDGAPGEGWLVVVEIGAGTAVPTVRLASEHLARRPGATLIRINPREPECPAGGISLPCPGLPALAAIDAILAEAGLA